MEEYYLGKNTWSGVAADWKQRFEVGDAIIDPAGDWDPSTAQAYIDQQIATVTSDLASEVVARQAGDTGIQDQVNIIKKNRIYLTGTTLTQSMINTANTIYVVKDDLILSENITIPANCVLEFDGGSLSNGTINLSDTIILGTPKYNNVNINGKFNLQKIDYRPIYYIEDFGGIANNSNVDNSSALEAAINAANKVGGVVRFKAANYYFSTPITISDRLVNIVIEGESWGVNADHKETGTTLYWKGIGWFITFYKSHKCIFRNFHLVCDGNNGIKYTGDVFLTIIERIRISEFINGLHIIDCAYLTLRMCQIGSGRTDVENNIILGSPDGGDNVEYFFMYNCACENSGGYGNGIMIYSGKHLFIRDCDFVQQNKAIYIYTKGLTRWVCIENTDITLCNTSIDIAMDNSGLFFTNISNVAVVLKDTISENDRVLKVRRISSKDMSSSNINILVNKKVDDPLNVLDADDYSFGNDTVVFINGSNTNNSSVYSKLRVRSGDIFPIKTTKREAIALKVTGDGVSTYTSIPIGPDLYENFSHNLSFPCIVQSRADRIASWNLSRDNGVIYCNITFKEPFTGKEYITIYCPQIFEVMNLNTPNG